MLDIKDELKSIPKFDLKGFKKDNYNERGGYGEVYLAKKKRELIAIKQIFPPKNVDHDSMAQLIINEINNLSKCSSFNQLIIKFLGISFSDLDGNSTDYPLIILDYANNGSLSSFLRKSKEKNIKLSNSTKMIFLYGIAKAMESIHFLHIAHRDLKPANVLLNNNLYPLLADLGLSKELDIVSNNSSSIVGTLDYESPEIINGTIKNNECFCADVFSYSYIMYYIISGKEPYEDDKEMYKKGLPYDFYEKFLATKRFDLPDDTFPSYFKHLISLLWQDNPKKRPTFGDIISLFDAGIILPILNEDELNDYLKYRKTIGVPSLLDEEKLIQKRDELEKENKTQLADVITLFLADNLKNPDAQTKIGIKYTYGDEFELDRGKGFCYFTKAANKNHPEALFYLGKAYKYGIGIGKNPDLARESLQKSYDLGYKLASDEINKSELKMKINVKKSSNLAVIFGSYWSGKTTFLNKIRDIYNNTLPQTTISNDEKSIYFKDNDGHDDIIRIRDTAGMEQYGKMNKSFFRDVKLAILLFDLNNYESFQSIDKWVNMLRDINDKANLIIIGNKSDLKRKVLKVNALKKANEYDADYFEISALYGYYIEYPKQKIIDYFKSETKMEEFQIVESKTVNVELLPLSYEQYPLSYESGCNC